MTFIVLCFRENIFLISEECSKNGGRRERERGGIEKREKKSIEERKRIQGPGEEGKIYVCAQEGGARFFVDENMFFICEIMADNHDCESRQR